MSTAIKASASQGATKALRAVLSHPATWVVLAIIAIIITYKSWAMLKRWWGNLSREDRSNTEGHAMNAADKARAEQLAHNLRAAIHSAFNTNRNVLINQALGLNDTELKYLAGFYQSINDGTSLWQDLDDEWTLPSAGNQLMGRLLQIAAPKAVNPEDLTNTD